MRSESANARKRGESQDISIKFQEIQLLEPVQDQTRETEVSDSEYYNDTKMHAQWGLRIWVRSY